MNAPPPPVSDTPAELAVGAVLLALGVLVLTPCAWVMTWAVVNIWRLMPTI